MSHLVYIITLFLFKLLDFLLFVPTRCECEIHIGFDQSNLDTFTNIGGEMWGIYDIFVIKIKTKVKRNKFELTCIKKFV